MDRMDFAVAARERSVWSHSENKDVHAGELIREALDGVGDGGGHAAMAGGLIRKENMELLGPTPEVKIHELFLNVLDKKGLMKGGV